MVSVYSRTMCLEVKPGTEVVRPQHVDEGTAEGPTLRKRPFQRKERHLGFWFNIYNT